MPKARLLVSAGREAGIVGFFIQGGVGANGIQRLGYLLP